MSVTVDRELLPADRMGLKTVGQVLKHIRNRSRIVVHVLIDGKEPSDVKPGVPTDAVTTLRLPAAEAGRPVVALFNQERIVVRAWPASENRIAVAELTY